MSKAFERFGNYILLEKLASGGMAEVYLAKKLATDGVQKYVAIKRILSQFSDSTDFIQMFKDEAKISVNLSHQHVVSIYDFGIEREQFYIVMEFVEGQNLRQILNRFKKINKQFSIGQIVDICKQVALGLDHAHRCIDATTGQPLNIIHRDMSPQNVMLNFDGNCMVVDFGIAKAATQVETTRAGTLKGKFGYMSPEQAEGMVVDLRTDIFALGIMLWEMLTGQRLFLANNEMNTLRRIRECKVPSLRKINPNIPPELEKICNRALAKDRNLRYQSAADLYRDLSGFLNRFDPDFSSQIMSEFLKSVFADDILELRKKQITYSKVEVETEYASHGDEERTEVVTQTGSIPGGSTLNNHLNIGTLANDHLDVEMKLDGIDLKSQKLSKNKRIKISQKLNDEVSTTKSSITKEHTKSNTLSSITNIANVNLTENQNWIPKAIFMASFLFLSLAVTKKVFPDTWEGQCVNFINLVGINLECGSGFGQENMASSSISGTLITSDPVSAKVYINGRPQKALTPMRVRLPENRPFTVTWYLTRHGTATQHFKKLPKKAPIKAKLKRIPSGFVKVTAIGEIYINDLRVPSGKAISVPANKKVLVKAVNPITKKIIQETIIVGPEKVRRVVLGGSK